MDFAKGLPIAVPGGEVPRVHLQYEGVRPLVVRHERYTNGQGGHGIRNLAAIPQPAPPLGQACGQTPNMPAIDQGGRAGNFDKSPERENRKGRYSRDTHSASLRLQLQSTLVISKADNEKHHPFQAMDVSPQWAAPLAAGWVPIVL